MKARWFGVVVGTILGAAACGSEERRDVVLVTLDTFRADRMSTFGGTAGITPRLDAFASDAVAFLDATAPTPITLPSHATLLTGRYPTRTGVRNNGSFVLGPGETTLAEILSDHGWATAAVVAAFPLHSRFGLAQGFRSYDDRFPETPPTRDRTLPILFSERPASEVTDRALEAWGRMRGGPRFLWVHYFDTHAPYAAPEPYRTAHADRPYDAEAAYVDAEFGRLVDRIRADSPGAVIVVTADHGESLGEHGEKTHGIFLYQATLHVPLVVSAPGILSAGTRIEEPVSLGDVLPTVLEISNLPIPPDVDGASLVGLAGGGEPPRRVIYAESYLPRLQFRFSELTALRAGPLKYIEAPAAELYDTVSDPAELRNLAEGHPGREALARSLAEFARGSGRGAPEGAEGGVDRETEARLQSLGYAAVGTLSPVAGEGRGRDPKSMVDYLERYDRAVELNASGRMEEGIRLLTALLPDAPENFMARYQLAAALLASGRLDEAAAYLKEVVRSAPEFSNGHFLLAEVEAERGRTEEAIESFRAAAAAAPALSAPHLAMGRVLEAAGRFEEAGEAYRSAIRIDPDDWEAGRRLVDLRAGRGEVDRAIAEIREASASAPGAASLRIALASALRRRGDLRAAFSAASDALELDPDSVDALVLSGELLLAAGEPGEAGERFERAASLDPNRPDALLGSAESLFARARAIDAEARLAALLRRFPRYAPAYRVRGEQLERAGDREGAIRSYRQALALQPGERGARAGLSRLGAR